MNNFKAKNKSKKYSKSLRTYVFNFLVLVVLSSNICVQGQETNNKNTAILGNWEGQIVVSQEKSAAIIWRFELSNKGELIGFMGPASKGVATLPMSTLLVKDSILSFSIQSQGSYSGHISNNRIAGIWSSKSGRKLAHNMARASFKKQVGTSKTTNDIHTSIKSGDIEQVKSFLEKGNDIDKIYSKGYTLLLYAIKKDRTNKISTYL